jgi:hypothetical protein
MGEVGSRTLFGGALSCAVPPSFVDVSDFRQVPDNQEVFADASQSDSSLVVEILEQPVVADPSTDPSSTSVPVAVADAAAVAYYLADLAEANDAADGAVFRGARRLTAEEMPQLAASSPAAAGCSAWVGAGDQAVSKVREGDHARNAVRVYAAVLRLPEINTDLLITMNVPLVISASSSSAASGGVGLHQLGGQGGEGGGGDPCAAATALFLSILKSLRIEDWGLFG